MISRKIRLLGLCTLATLVLGSVLTTGLGTGSALSSPHVAVPATSARTIAEPGRTQLAQAQTGISDLPGGASSLSETYKDWSVSCTHLGSQKRCAFSQVQIRQDGQRVLAVELEAPSGNMLSGVIVLPFGLAFESDVVLQIDDMPAMAPVRFRTCLPVGCLVPLALDAPTLVALRSGTVLKVSAVADGGAAIPFSISLAGFGSALDRVAALLHQ